MTNLDDRSWRVDLRQNCGSELGDEQCTLRWGGGVYCRVQAARKFVSNLVFQAPKTLSLRDHVLQAAESARPFIGCTPFGGRLDSLARARLGGSTHPIW
jgi:hypothetical protein